MKEDNPRQTSKRKSSKFGVMFDFDHTLVDVNTDTHIFNPMEKKAMLEMAKNIHKKEPSGNLAWRIAVQSAVHHKRESLAPKSLYDFIHNEAFKDVKFPMATFIQSNFFDKGVDVYIISDANTRFIEAILDHVSSEFKHQFKEIITNPAYWIKDNNFKSQPIYQTRPSGLYLENDVPPLGSLFIEPFMRLDLTRTLPWIRSPEIGPWDKQQNLMNPKIAHLEYTCACQLNMCKHTIVSHLIHRDKYDHLFFVGDGKNDYCALKALRPNDVIFVRSEYGLATEIKEKGLPKRHPKVVYWDSHDVLQKAMEKAIHQIESRQ